ncbi:hypothetical protein OEZ60_19100 [Defluviimonas sp. WL0024]|uniref:DUF1127 domain-containing protein n=1 Tax=Albidovulum salinarum TaxID=2984153 RepID=A0ABT2X831_9RHOB|nr:hypothetical protein [Defluviimonas sp. WL0024]MCU9850106.1 hypothetical protein [Defluviimonas sp. WL0024]
MLNANATTAFSRRDTVYLDSGLPRPSVERANRSILPTGAASVGPVDGTAGVLAAASATEDLPSTRQSRIGFAATCVDAIQAAVTRFLAARKARAGTRTRRIAATEMTHLSNHILRDIGLAQGRTDIAPFDTTLRGPRV